MTAHSPSPIVPGENFEFLPRQHLDHLVHGQSEAQLENDLLARLQEQGIEQVSLDDEAALLANLRKQLARLNEAALQGQDFSDEEWATLLDTYLAPRSDSLADKRKRVHKGHYCQLKRDDGRVCNIHLFDKKDLGRNQWQVMHQFTQTGRHENRYDVTLLLNGLPMVGVELKRRGKSLRDAFNQIKRYGRDSFWAGRALFEYIQLYVISNGGETRYFANSARELAQKSQVVSDSFEMTSCWATRDNRHISRLEDAAGTLLSPNTLTQLILRFCVLTSDDRLMFLRPYQVAAVESMVQQVSKAQEDGLWGQREAGGYIWHTTGSGKTLTSFKAAQIISQMPSVDKVLFVVDRKDLDSQTNAEYEAFEKGSVQDTASTRALESHLTDRNVNIVVTTIQKLAKYCSAQQLTGSTFNGNAVIIFDECHRSQFGEQHRKIKETFPQHAIFGFTGTPIMAENKNLQNLRYATTESLFGAQLHCYTIQDAIADRNVLRFKVDYVNTIQTKKDVADADVMRIDDEEVLHHPERIARIVSYILRTFKDKTRQHVGYIYKGNRYQGFNALLAVDSIPTLRLYYEAFKAQLAEDTTLGTHTATPLKIAAIYSFALNGTAPEDQYLDGDDGLPSEDDRNFLEGIIGDYNKTFGTAFNTGKEFAAYHNDISQRMKTRQIDLLIVVNMFLTGFDAPVLNTLWVDKNLQYHGLIQTFSRTNRKINDCKPFGNVICFRNLKDATDNAIALFSDKKAQSTVLVRAFEDYFFGYEDAKGKHVKGYLEVLKEMVQKYPLEEAQSWTSGSEKAQKGFVGLYSQMLRLSNILKSCDEFEARDALLKEAGLSITQADIDEYQGHYLDISERFKSQEKAEETSVVDDVQFELALVRQDEVNIDYILEQIAKFNKGNSTVDELKATVRRKMEASIELRSKIELIMRFIDRVCLQGEKISLIQFIDEQKEVDLKAFCTEKGLDLQKTTDVFNHMLRKGTFSAEGTVLDDLPVQKLSLFGSFSGASSGAYEMREPASGYALDDDAALSPKMRKRIEIESGLHRLFERYADIVVRP